MISEVIPANTPHAQRCKGEKKKRFRLPLHFSHSLCNGRRRYCTLARTLACTHAGTHAGTPFINSHLHGYAKRLVLRRSADVNSRASGAIC